MVIPDAPEVTEHVAELSIELSEMPRLTFPAFPLFLGQASRSNGNFDPAVLGDCIDISIASNGAAIYLHEMATGRHFSLSLRPVLEEACRAVLERLGVQDEEAREHERDCYMGAR